MTSALPCQDSVHWLAAILREVPVDGGQHPWTLDGDHGETYPNSTQRMVPEHCTVFQRLAGQRARKAAALRWTTWPICPFGILRTPTCLCCACAQRMSASSRREQLLFCGRPMEVCKNKPTRLSTHYFCTVLGEGWCNLQSIFLKSPLGWDQCCGMLYHVTGSYCIEAYFLPESISLNLMRGCVKFLAR